MTANFSLVEIEIFESVRKTFEKMPPLGSDDYPSAFNDLIAQFASGGEEYVLVGQIYDDLIESTILEKFDTLTDADKKVIEGIYTLDLLDDNEGLYSMEELASNLSSRFKIWIEDNFSLDDEEDDEDEVEDEDAEEVDEKESAHSSHSPQYLILNPINPVDNLEKILREKENWEMANKVKCFWSENDFKCDTCEKEIDGRHMIDGKRSTSWEFALMCPKCHNKYGDGFGEGKGQLYTQLENGQWLETFGFTDYQLGLTKDDF